MSTGFIKIDRQIKDWRWWGNTNAMAIWLYILVNVNWTDGYWDHGKTIVRRGEMITSQSKMAAELGINRKTLRKYLNLFQMDGQIACSMDNRYTRISVLNYERFQGSGVGTMDN